MSSRRLPAVAFGLLAVATLGAFLVIQVVKTANPLVWPTYEPTPAAFDPVNGRASACFSPHSHKHLDYRMTQVKLAVSRADSVAVYIVSARHAAGAPVATISSGTPMQRSVLGTDIWHPKTFTWGGRLSNGAIAPDGTYYFRVVLHNEGQSIDLSNKPIQVLTRPAQARVLSVSVTAAGAGTTTGTTTTTSAGAVTTGTNTTAGTDTTTTAGTGTATTGTGKSSGAKHAGPAVFAPPGGHVTIRYTPPAAVPGHAYRRVWLDVYRTDVTGKPSLVAHLAESRKRHVATWNGEIAGAPAPAGTYLVGITAQNAACDQSSWPVVLPPAAGTTPGAGLTIRYLSVTPPLTPTVSGSRASVAVASPRAGYTWTLRRTGTAKVLAHGAGPAGDTQIHVRMPPRVAALYTLVVRSGTQSSAVPLVASRAGATAAKARVLVVLPVLTWVGNSPVDDTGDGLPDTLRAGDAVSLARPLVDGPPAGLGDDAALLSYLGSQHLSYQLTTDVALAEKTGPSLVDRWGVLFPDGADYLPQSLGVALSGFVKGGGRVLALGAGSFRGLVHLAGFPTDTHAGAPKLTRSDPFGAQRGPLTPTHGELITELADQLNLFGGLVAFTGFSHYQPIEPPAGVPVSAAGIASRSAAIVAFRLGSGTVTEVGLPNFGVSLAHNIDSEELLNDAWRLLAKQR